MSGIQSVPMGISISDPDHPLMVVIGLVRTDDGEVALKVEARGFEESDAGVESDRSPAGQPQLADRVLMAAGFVEPGAIERCDLVGAEDECARPVSAHGEGLRL